jgi:hypothetical protein
VLADVLLRGLKELRDVLLGEPDGVVLQSDFDPHPPVFRVVHKELFLGRQIWFSRAAHGLSLGSNRARNWSAAAQRRFSKSALALSFSEGAIQIMRLAAS